MYFKGLPIQLQDLSFGLYGIVHIVMQLDAL